MPVRTCSIHRLFYPVGTDYAASFLNCNFMRNALCGNPRELPGGDLGFSVWPDTALGGRVRVKLTTDAYLRAGAFGVDPHLYTDPQDHSGRNIDASQYNGVKMPVEFAWEPSFGAGHLVATTRL
jgi:porin